jgi:hypothetical protein
VSPLCVRPWPDRHGEESKGRKSVQPRLEVLGEERGVQRRYSFFFNEC